MKAVFMDNSKVGNTYDMKQVKHTPGPELLDLLKAAVARIEMENNTKSLQWPEGNPIMSAWLIDAKVAIARVEGR